jgi:predicted XRE-type DNA-binding protein
VFGIIFSEEHKNNLRKNHADFKGKNHPGYKIIIQDVIQIKLLLKEGILTQQEIADIFNICRRVISNIKTGKIWSHIKL